MTIRVTGLRQTVRSLERMGVEVADLKDAMTRIGDLVADEAKPLARHLSGRMAASIRPGRAKSKAVVRAGNAGVPYAGVQHFGGYHGITPNPFLTDALIRKEPDAVRELYDSLNALIRKHDLT